MINSDDGNAIVILIQPLSVSTNASGLNTRAGHLSPLEQRQSVGIYEIDLPAFPQFTNRLQISNQIAKVEPTSQKAKLLTILIQDWLNND
jgi:hypothetical protein